LSKNPLVELVDVFFNGRPASKEPPKPSVNWPELIRRKDSVVMVGGKLYHVSVTPAKVESKP